MDDGKGETLARKASGRVKERVYYEYFVLSNTFPYMYLPSLLTLEGNINILEIDDNKKISWMPTHNKTITMIIQTFDCTTT